MNNRIEILEAMLAVLLELPYTTAYIGDLGEVKQSSYTPYSEVVKQITKIRREIDMIKGKVAEMD